MNNHLLYTRFNHRYYSIYRTRGKPILGDIYHATYYHSGNKGHYYIHSNYGPFELNYGMRYIYDVMPVRYSQIMFMIKSHEN
jgi:hypothetical protein